jgi:hypothetical protein
MEEKGKPRYGDGGATEDGGGLEVVLIVGK